MDQLSIDLKVPVPKSGFRLEKGRVLKSDIRMLNVWMAHHDPGDPTTRLIQAVKKDEFEIKEPLKECPGLFRQFAQLEAPEDYLQFANENGPLLSLERHGESLGHWKAQTGQMAFLVRYHQLWEAGDGSSIVQLFRDWKKSDQAITLFSSNPNLDPFAFGTKEVLEAAPYWTVKTVEKMLDGRLGVTSKYSPKRGFVPSLKPEDLLAGLWLQAWIAIRRNKEFDHCENCFRFIPRSSGNARSDKKFCSDACRASSYRRRKRQARVLRSKGASLNEIARKVESDLATVKGWVKDVKKGGA